MAQKSTERQPSNFAQTCNRLSQYLKNGGSFGDIRTMNLFPAGENSPEASGKAPAPPPAFPMSLDALPQLSALGSSSLKEEPTITNSHSRKPADPEAAQMTIFYAGQVIVFDAFPADKAKEIMDAAKLASSRSTTTTTSTGFLGAPTTVDKNVPTSSASPDSNKVEEQLQLQPEADAGSSPDLSIARRDSLRRFLMKRKDRVAAKAPYQLNKPEGPSRPQESGAWIDLEAEPSKHLDLNL